MINFYIDSFSSNKQVFKDLFSGLSKESYLWREAPDKWNLLEIVCHLYDEEREDFRSRLDSVLKDPTQSFTPFDPTVLIAERKYAEQHFEEMIEKFLGERQYTLNWLEQLSNPKWDNAFQHPKIGPMSGSFIIANWLAHDYLHIRQVIRIKFNYLKEKSTQKLHYAGAW